MNNLTIAPHKPSLLVFKAAICLLTNEELIKELDIVDTHLLTLYKKINSGVSEDLLKSDLDYYEQKQALLRKALNTRNSGRL